MQKLHFHFHFLLLSLCCCYVLALSWSQSQQFGNAKNYEGSSDLVDIDYHMGPVLASPINLYIIWYGRWNWKHQAIMRDFVYSLLSSSSFPSVADWWRTVRLYTDQTGSKITGSIVLSGEFYDSRYSHGSYPKFHSLPTVPQWLSPHPAAPACKNSSQ